MDPKYYEPWNCARCGREYREIDNLSRWQCAVHPGEYYYAGCSVPIDRRTYSIFHWMCCGRSQDSEDPHYEGMRPIGCRPADHMPGVGRYSLQEPSDCDDAPFFPLLEAVPLDVLGFAKLPPKQVVCTLRGTSDEAKTYSYTDWDGAVLTFVPALIPRFADINARGEEPQIGEYDEPPDEDERERFRAYSIVARAAPSLNRDKVVRPGDTRRCGFVQ